MNIGGMTCVHCRDKIQSALTQTGGVSAAEVDYAAGTAEIEYDAEAVGKEDIEKIISGLGYKVLPDKTRSALYPLFILAVIVAVFVPLQCFGLLNYLAPSSLAESGMGYGMLFLIGLITSVHCVAMCGGINLSQCLPKTEEGAKGFKAFIPALFYNLGRVVSYTLIGFILGFIGWCIGGEAVGISNVLQGVLKIIAGILMIIMGVNMLGIIPALRRLNPTLPKFLRRAIGKKRSSVASPFLVGVLNGVMPRGPLQSTWIVALATGSPFGGALAMLLFALGTVPLMLGLGSVVAKLGQRFTKAVTAVGAVLVVVLGLAMLAQGGSLTGFAFLSPVPVSAAVISLIFVGVIFSMPAGTKLLKPLMRVAACCLAVLVMVVAFRGNYGPYEASVVEGDVQTVTCELASGKYPNISVVRDVPVRWIITADEASINGCNYKLQIPEYGIEYVLRAGENIIEFTPVKAGSFSYSCWMGMIYGSIRVTG